MALLEFALALPLFLGVALSGIEFANYSMANNRVQRLASMAADLIAQSGAGTAGSSEAQIYDLFNALDLTAKPYDMRTRGRIVITSVKGTDDDDNKVTENTILWQRFDGAYVAASPVVGCATATKTATLPQNRLLPLDEITFHVQVSYQYQPVFLSRPYDWLNLPTSFTRIAMFRARSSNFQNPSPVTNFPAKKKCTTANGL